MKKIIMYVLLASGAAAAAFYFTHKDFVLGRIGMSFTNKPADAAQTDSVGNVSKGGKRVLTAYFSWGANTRKTARKIHERVGGDIIEIRPAETYPHGYRDTVKAYGEELKSGRLPEITFAKVDMAQYDYILIGYPIWYNAAPLIIEKFLRSVDTAGKTVLPFATSGGSGIEGSLAGIAEAAPKAVIGEALLANDSSRIPEWLERNGLL